MNLGTSACFGRQCGLKPKGALQLNIITLDGRVRGQVSIGPAIIFDKSTLESLSPDESVWLDNFFCTNITPLFFVETLADLEKETRRGRSPEQVVGSLAYKTPDAGSRANVHHARVIEAELAGGIHIEMDGRPVIAGGVEVELGGESGLVYRPSAEDEALLRWQKHEFVDIERQTAKHWRRQLAALRFDDLYQAFRPALVRRGMPPAEAKAVADSLLGQEDRENAFRMAMSLVGISPEGQSQVLLRWRGAGTPSIRAFAPYFSHVATVDLYFAVAIASDLISRDRPSHRVDMAYLYYLPFCDVFTSNDNLHALTCPLFLNDRQLFIPGHELKTELNAVDQFYSKLPEEVRREGVYRFAAYPPATCDYLVTRLWDRYRTGWRDNQAVAEKAMHSGMPGLADEIIKFATQATPVNPARASSSREPRNLVIERRIHSRKGKWNRFPASITGAKR